MRRLPFLVLSLALAVAAWGNVGVHAATFPINYSDPASDVVKLNSTTGLCEVDGDGNCVMSPDPSDVNILWLRGRDEGTQLNFTIEVKGRIQTQSNTTYVVNFYADATNQTHWKVNYTNGVLLLYTNLTGASRTDISGSATVWGPNPTQRNQLSVFVDKALLGGASNLSSSVNLDATAIMRGNPHSYQDFGWQVPGNPGSTPTVLRGTVYVKGTTTPIEGARVAIADGPSVLTDAAGFYQFSLSAGNYEVTVTAEDYVTATFTVALNTGETVTRDVGLERTVASVAADFLLPLLVLLAVVGIIAFLYLRKRRKRETMPPPYGPYGR